MELTEPTFVVIDFETVTPAGRRPHPIEVAACAARYRDGSLTETGRFTSLIQPPDGISLTRYDIAQTGITPDMLADAEPAATVLAALDGRLRQPPYLLVAHNAPYEAGLLYDWRTACPVLARTPLLDTVRLARAAYPGLPRHRLDDLLRHLDIPAPADRHRALPDVLATLAVFERLLAGGHDLSHAEITPKLLEEEREAAKGEQESLFAP
ncbi:PolC-type DNA polymerase III [Spongiactinospora sp. 9N601]|uniref:PolC-type DNA polymerase III n=1 Tax=Spongiactinospora sp. 9N601 TaxID=3375149 RepID=UPI0037ACF559